MGYKFLIAFCCAVLVNVLSVSDAHAKIPIFYGSPEKIVKIHDLPKTDDYRLRSGEHFDLGYMYKTYELMWIPLHATQGKIVGYVNDKTYVSLTARNVDLIVKINNIQDVNSLAKIPFWDLWGGKLLALIIVIFLITIFLRKGDRSAEENENNS